MSDGPAGPRALALAVRAGRSLAGAALTAGALVLLAILALTCADVAGRYLLGAPVNGKTELTRFLMAGLIACALPVVSVTGEHVTMDLLDRFVRGRAAAVQDFLVDLICAGSLATLAWWLAFRSERLLARGYVSDFLAIPLYPVAYFVTAMVAISGAALGLKLLVDAYYVARPDLRPERSGPALPG